MKTREMIEDWLWRRRRIAFQMILLQVQKRIPKSSKKKGKTHTCSSATCSTSHQDTARIHPCFCISLCLGIEPKIQIGTQP